MRAPSSSLSIEVHWKGVQPYLTTLAAQRERRQQVIAGGPEVVWVLEHESVVTVGRRPVEDLAGVRALDVPIVQTERGGLATWHGPGQLVAYPVIDIGRRGIRVRDFVRALETACLQCLLGLGVPAERSSRGVGVFVGGAKIASVGIHVQRGVTLHGVSVNLSNTLEVFERFDPCGLGVPMTRASDHAESRSPLEVAPDLGRRITEAVDTLTRHDYAKAAEGS